MISVGSLCRSLSEQACAFSGSRTWRLAEVLRRDCLSFVRRLSRRYIKVLLELLQKRPVQEMFVMMSEDDVRSLLATLQELDRMKIANTDAAVGILLIVLGEDLPVTKK